MKRCTLRNTDHWFGRKPPADATVAWGARGLIEDRGRRIHFAPSNASWSDATPAERTALSTWINSKGIPALKKSSALIHGEGHDVVTFRDGSRAIEASRQGANSYVYVVAWTTAKKPARKAEKNRFSVR